MNFAIIYTVMILIFAIPVFLTDIAQNIPLGMRIFVLVFALAVLWLYIIFFKRRNKMGFGGVILLILFYFFTFVIIVPTGVVSSVIFVLERGQMDPPIIIGNEENIGKIYIVYHPGTSAFTTSTLKKLAENIAQNNYQVTLYRVNKDLKLDLQGIKTIGFASPIYVGNVRKPLIRYIQEDNLSGKKCFVIVTGADKEGLEKDTLEIIQLIEDRGGQTIGKTKFITSDKENELEESIDIFARELLNELK